MSAAAPAAPTTQHGAFLRTRLGSLLAIAPLGVWVTIHLWNNLAAFRGADAWQVAVTEHPHPVAHALTLIVVLAPLLLHTVWGVLRLFTARPNNLHYGFYANFKYALQRLSAVGVLLFVGAHLSLAFIKPRFLEGHPEQFVDISHEMATHLPTLAVYLLGTLGVAYHLGNGIGTFAMGWGLVSSRNALKKMEYVSIGTFLVLLTMSWSAIYALWQAGR
jgi:succinate dehydrogenase / fumarate reductase cytochrome b subunit